MDTKPSYLSYLLRVWRTRDGEREVWRASLEHPGSGEKAGFADLHELLDYLLVETGQRSNPRSDTKPVD